MQKRLLVGYLFIIIILFNSGCSQFKEYKHVFILELSIPDLMISLSDYSSNSDFRSAISDANEAQLTSSDDFITLFAEAWHTQVAYQESPTQLWRIFHNMNNHDLFPAKSTDEEIIEILASEAKAAINNTERIITKRISNNYTYQNRINFKINQLPNCKLEIITSAIEDKNNFRKTLVSSGNVEFWPVLFNDEVYNKIIGAEISFANSIHPNFYGDNALADSTLSPEQLESKFPIQSKGLVLISPQRGEELITVGYAHKDDRENISEILNNPLIKADIGEDVKFAWSSNPTTVMHKGDLGIDTKRDSTSTTSFYKLYALNDKSRRGKAELTGKSIINAQQSKNVKGEIVVDMTMNAAGTSTWAFMTEKCAVDNRSIAVMLDNLVYSAPTVNEPILGGKSEITLGNKNNAVAEARDLAGLLNVGSLPARCIILGEWEYEDYVSESF